VLNVTPPVDGLFRDGAQRRPAIVRHGKQACADSHASARIYGSVNAIQAVQPNLITTLDG
jgi:hypothetical protein